MLINSNLAKTLNTEKKDNFESNTRGRPMDILSTNERFILWSWNREENNLKIISLWSVFFNNRLIFHMHWNSVLI